MKRPEENEYAPYYDRYISLVPEKDIMAAYEKHGEIVAQAFVEAGVKKGETFAYAVGKWSIREMLGHLIDAERVFGFRAYTFSRFDPNPLPSFEENDYIRHSPYAKTPLAELAAEFLFLHSANKMLYARMGEEEWSAVGTASNNKVSVRALAYMTVGHARHHLSVLHERYR